MCVRTRRRLSFALKAAKASERGKVYNVDEAISPGAWKQNGLKEVQAGGERESGELPTRQNVCMWRWSWCVLAGGVEWILEIPLV